MIISQKSCLYNLILSNILLQEGNSEIICRIQLFEQFLQQNFIYSLGLDSRRDRKQRAQKARQYLSVNLKRNLSQSSLKGSQLEL